MQHGTLLHLLRHHHILLHPSCLTSSGIIRHDDIHITHATDIAITTITTTSSSKGVDAYHIPQPLLHHLHHTTQHAPHALTHHRIQQLYYISSFGVGDNAAWSSPYRAEDAGCQQVQCLMQCARWYMCGGYGVCAVCGLSAEVHTTGSTTNTHTNTTANTITSTNAVEETGPTGIHHRDTAILQSQTHTSIVHTLIALLQHRQTQQHAHTLHRAVAGDEFIHWSHCGGTCGGCSGVGCVGGG
mmetsp:Transcript_2115/g.3358  ORF Transcript_2115/g.3358 Transcript_2115/m.3358 type:complete len:242 (+) Transcript_2115:2990-3715(+)